MTFSNHEIYTSATALDVAFDSIALDNRAIVKPVHRTDTNGWMLLTHSNDGHAHIQTVKC